MNILNKQKGIPRIISDIYMVEFLYISQMKGKGGGVGEKSLQLKLKSQCKNYEPSLGMLAVSLSSALALAWKYLRCI